MEGSSHLGHGDLLIFYSCGFKSVSKATAMAVKLVLPGQLNVSININFPAVCLINMA
jgi:hypothetical protein